MGYLSNTENIVNSNGRNWSIEKIDGDIKFTCWREEGVPSSYKIATT